LFRCAGQWTGAPIVLRLIAGFCIPPAVTNFELKLRKVDRTLGCVCFDHNAVFRSVDERHRIKDRSAHRAPPLSSACASSSIARTTISASFSGASAEPGGKRGRLGRRITVTRKDDDERAHAGRRYRIVALMERRGSSGSPKMRNQIARNAANPCLWLALLCDETSQPARLRHQARCECAWRSPLALTGCGLIVHHPTCSRSCPCSRT
jgi:hypothetical protein